MRQPEGREAQVGTRTRDSRHAFEHHVGTLTLLENSALWTKEQSHLALGQHSAPHLSHHGPSQAPEGTDQVLFPAAAALDPQVGAIVSSYASSGQDMCTAGQGRGLWTEAMERLKAPGWKSLGNHPI